MRRLQWTKSKKYLPPELQNPFAQPDLAQIKKTRRFLGDLAIWATTRLSFKIRGQMRTQEPSSKFGLLPRGLINSVYNTPLIFCNLSPSLSPREGASGSVLRFSWFGEELHGKASLVWVWDPDLRSNGQKTNGFSSKSIEIPPISKTLAGYDRSRAN